MDFPKATMHEMYSSKCMVLASYAQVRQNKERQTQKI